MERYVFETIIIRKSEKYIYIINICSIFLFNFKKNKLLQNIHRNTDDWWLILFFLPMSVFSKREMLPSDFNIFSMELRKNIAADVGWLYQAKFYHPHISLLFLKRFDPRMYFVFLGSIYFCKYVFLYYIYRYFISSFSIGYI